MLGAESAGQYFVERPGADPLRRRHLHVSEGILQEAAASDRWGGPLGQHADVAGLLWKPPGRRFDLLCPLIVHLYHGHECLPDSRIRDGRHEARRVGLQARDVSAREVAAGCGQAHLRVTTMHHLCKCARVGAGRLGSAGIGPEPSEPFAESAPAVAGRQESVPARGLLSLWLGVRFPPGPLQLLSTRRRIIGRRRTCSPSSSVALKPPWWTPSQAERPNRYRRIGELKSQKAHRD